MLYLSIKDSAKVIIGKHFPPELARRFTFRMDSEIFIPKEDEATWRRKKENRENLHVMFDGTEIFEVPIQLNQDQAEWWILKAFRDSIANGTITLTKIAEHMSTDDVKRVKKEREKKKRKIVEDTIRESVARPMNESELNYRIAQQTKKARKAQKLIVEVPEDL